MNSSNQTTPLLEVRNLSKHFGAVRALNDFSMAVRSGEVMTPLCQDVLSMGSGRC